MLVGAFWKSFSEKEKKQEIHEDLFSFEALLTLSNELPYPLGYRLNEFIEESKAFLEGKGSTNYAFLLASMNGLALRFHAIVALCAYVHFLKAPDTGLNREIIEGLQLPADGTWKGLLDHLLREEHCHSHPWLQSQREMLYTRVPFFERKRGLAVIVAMQEMVNFRNHLLHGSHRFTNQELKEAMQKIQLLFSSMKPWATARLEVIWKGELLPLRGLALFTRGEKKEEQFELETPKQKEAEKQIVQEKRFPLFSYAAKGQKEESCSLFPMLFFVESRQEPEIEREIFFFNGLRHEEAEYISYRYPRSRDHHSLGLFFQEITPFFKRLPAVRLQPKVRIDYFELVRTHLQAFVGREKQLQAIYTFLAQRPRPYGVVYGRGGMGKTALFARLYHAYQKEEKMWPKDMIALWHFCGSTDGRDHAVVFWRSVLAQLDRQMDGQEANYPHTLDSLQMLWQERLQTVAKRGKRVALIVDGLDEGDAVASPLFSIPAHLPRQEQIPDHLTLLCSYRSDEQSEEQGFEKNLPVSSTLLHLIEDASPLRGLDWSEMIQMLSLVQSEMMSFPETISAIWRMATQTDEEIRSSPSEANKSSRSEASFEKISHKKENQEKEDLCFTRDIHKKNKENYADPLLLRFLYEELQDGRIDPKRAESVPQSLHTIFDRTWNQLPIHHSYLLVRILGMLSIMPNTGSDAFFCAVFEEEEKQETRKSFLLFPEEIAKQRIPINRWLTFRKDQYTIFHRRFREYIQQHFHPRDQETALHEPIYRYCISKNGRFQAYDLLYRVHHLSHLACSGRVEISERAREEIVKLLQEQDGFFSKKWIMFQRTDLIYEDFLKIARAFLPKKDSSSSNDWLSFTKIYFLCLYTHETLQETRHPIHLDAEKATKEGKQNKLLQPVEKNSEQQLWSGVQHCLWLVRSGHSFAAVWRFLHTLLPILSQEEAESIQRGLEGLPLTPLDLGGLIGRLSDVDAQDHLP
jgi:hypothetical protein